MRLIKILLFILISYSGFSQNIGVRQVRGLQGSLNSKYSSATSLSDSTGFTLNRPNGTKDTIQIAIPASIDTTGKFVNRITKNATNDSFYVWKGTGYTALKDSVGSGGGSSSGLDTSAIHKTGDETIRSGVKTIVTPFTTTTTPLLYYPFKYSPSYNVGAANDTTAGAYFAPTFSGTANKRRYGLYSTYDISVNDIRIGGGRANSNTNAVLGNLALDAVNPGINHVAIGQFAMQNAGSASGNNVAIGYNSSGSLTTGSSNTAVGYNSLYGATNSVLNNAAFGQYALGQTTGSNGVGIGTSAGRLSSGSGVFIGSNAGINETGSDKLYINNKATGGLIHGDFLTGQVQINGQAGQAILALPSASTFTVNNQPVLSNRGAISSPRMLQANRDLIAVQSGVVTKIEIATNGTGYSSAPTVAISGTGTGATATAALVSGNIIITVTAGGTGYTPGSTTVTLTGGGFSVATTAFAIVGAEGLSVYCVDCTATDGSRGVQQFYNGTAWKNSW